MFRNFGANNIAYEGAHGRTLQGAITGANN